jgi:hypothetical protein
MQLSNILLLKVIPVEEIEEQEKLNKFRKWE